MPRTWFLRAVLALIVTVPGCADSRTDSPAEQSRKKDVSGAEFDTSRCGVIRGCVSWEGAVPKIALFNIPPNPLAGEVFRKKHTRPNPHVPIVDAATGGIGNAVIFLRGVDPKQGRPWDHPPVQLEMRDCQLHIRQGESDSAFGFVRCGDRVAMVSRDRWFHSLHAAEAAYFGLTFPDKDQPLERVLSQKGMVEWTSAAGYYWMRAYIFVDDHPYYARTNAQGRFELPGVPAGRYEIVCWMPNWNESRHERDPESSAICRLFFKKPFESVQPVTVPPSGTVGVDFKVSSELFSAHQPNPR
jgi:hypothetical protein